MNTVTLIVILTFSPFLNIQFVAMWSEMLGQVLDPLHKRCLDLGFKSYVWLCS